MGGSSCVGGRTPTGSPRHLADGDARLSAGDSRSLALGGNGVLHAWGDNSYQQCDVPWPQGGIVSVSAGDTFGLALIAGMSE